MDQQLLSLGDIPPQLREVAINNLPKKYRGVELRDGIRALLDDPVTMISHMTYEQLLILFPTINIAEIMCQLDRAIEKALSDDAKNKDFAYAIYEESNKQPDKRLRLHQLAEEHSSKQSDYNLGDAIDQLVASWGAKNDGHYQYQREEARRQLLDFYLTTNVNPREFDKMNFAAHLNPSNNRKDLALRTVIDLQKYLEKIKLTVLRDKGDNIAVNQLLTCANVDFYEKIDAIIATRLNGMSKEQIMRDLHDLSADEEIIQMFFDESKNGELGQSMSPELCSIKNDIDHYLNLEKRLRFFPEMCRAILENEFLKGVDEDTLMTLFDTALELTLNPEYKLVVTVGYGGTEDDLNVRVPAYCVAAANFVEAYLGIQEKMQDSGLPIGTPTLRLFSGHNAAVIANAMDQNRLDSNADKILDYTLAYLKKFHPKVAELSICHVDSPDIYTSAECTTLLEILNNCATETNKVREQLRRMGENHGGEQGAATSAFYASIHPLLFLDTVPVNEDMQNLLLPNIEVPDAVIAIGGAPEMQFNRIRKAIRDEAAAVAPDQFRFPKSIQLISRAGAKPVYYKHPEGDLTLADVVNGKKPPKLATGVKDDLKIIERDVKDYSAFMEFTITYGQACQ